MELKKMREMTEVELNAELLQGTVSAVLVTRQTVRLQLKNGQIIGKDDLV